MKRAIFLTTIGLAACALVIAPEAYSQINATASGSGSAGVTGRSAAGGNTTSAGTSAGISTSVGGTNVDSRTTNRTGVDRSTYNKNRDASAKEAAETRMSASTNNINTDTNAATKGSFGIQSSRGKIRTGSSVVASGEIVSRSGNTVAVRDARTGTVTSYTISDEQMLNGLNNGDSVQLYSQTSTGR